jgi:hypothetical protein
MPSVSKMIKPQAASTRIANCHWTRVNGSRSMRGDLPAHCFCRRRLRRGLTCFLDTRHCPLPSAAPIGLVAFLFLLLLRRCLTVAVYLARQMAINHSRYVDHSAFRNERKRLRHGGTALRGADPKCRGSDPLSPLGVGEIEFGVGGADMGFGQTEFAAHDIGPGDQ